MIFLARFARNLSEVTSLMRQLLQKQAEFVWDSPSQESFDKVKDILTQTHGPVLACYHVSKEIILQVDASKYRLGATLIQEGRPLAYASKALTPTEVTYAQIEKKMYAILLRAKRFYQFVYGRHVIVQTDHKPLVDIKKKKPCMQPQLSSRECYCNSKSLTWNSSIYLVNPYPWLIPSQGNLPKIPRNR